MDVEAEIIDLKRRVSVLEAEAAERQAERRAELKALIAECMRGVLSEGAGQVNEQLNADLADLFGRIPQTYRR